MKDFSVKFYLSDDEYLTPLRLATGAICNVYEIDVETLEDFKVCVTESVLIFKNGGFESVAVTFSDRDGLCCEVSGSGGEPYEGDNELSLALIPALVGECKFISNGKIIEKVILKI